MRTLTSLTRPQRMLLPGLPMPTAKCDQVVDPINPTASAQRCVASRYLPSYLE